MTKKIVLTMLAAVSFASAGSASESSIFGAPAYLEGTYSTQDLWRGQNQGSDDLKIVVGADLHFAGFETTTTLAWSDNSAQEELEAGLTVYKDVMIPVIADATLVAQLNYYSEGTDVVGDVTTELGVGISKAYGFGTVSVTQFFALDGDNDSYGEVSLDVGEIAPGITLTGILGYLLEDTQATHVEVTATLPSLSVPYISLELDPFLKGVYTFDDRGGIWSEDGAEVVFGVSTSYSF